METFKFESLLSSFVRCHFPRGTGALVPLPILKSLPLHAAAPRRVAQDPRNEASEKKAVFVN